MNKRFEYDEHWRLEWHYAQPSGQKDYNRVRGWHWPWWKEKWYFDTDEYVDHWRSSGWRTVRRERLRGWIHTG